MTRPFHILTVDVEDWPQSTLDHSLPIGPRVVANTHALLDIMNEAKVRATFFVLGKVAETHPNLAREIVAAGHEVGTHGYSHESIDTMPAGRFKEELHRSVDLLRQQTGQPVVGHRAADFSISGRFLHLLEYLADQGLTYDSSIFPIRHPRYGVPNAWRRPHRVLCASGQMLIEFPLPTIRLAGVAFPAAGGGYLRLFPFWLTRMTLEVMSRQGLPATCYVHPYELDTAEFAEIPYRVPTLLRWTQNTQRHSVRHKLQQLFSAFRFITMDAACKELLADQLDIGLDLTRSPATYQPQPWKAFAC